MSAAGKAAIDGVVWPAGATVVLDPTTGRPQRGSWLLAAETTYRGVDWPAQAALALDARAAVVSAFVTIVTTTTFRGHRYEAGTNLKLDPRTGAVLAADHFIEREGEGE